MDQVEKDHFGYNTYAPSRLQYREKHTNQILPPNCTFKCGIINRSGMITYCIKTSKWYPQHVGCQSDLKILFG